MHQMSGTVVVASNKDRISDTRSVVSLSTLNTKWGKKLNMVSSDDLNSNVCT